MKNWNCYLSAQSSNDFDKNFIVLLANHPVSRHMRIDVIKTLLTSSSSCVCSIFRIYYTLLIWVWRKLAGVLSMVFHTSTGCIRLTQISIFHHYFKCTEHCMNFNKQTLFLKGNLFSEGVPLLKSAVSQSRSGHVF